MDIKMMGGCGLDYWVYPTQESEHSKMQEIFSLTGKLFASQEV
jgi:hypothetical protein